jgi:glycosyltransferase involved in cell wall biosynthesis
MRVLHIGKFFPPHPGGIERTCADLCGALSRSGVTTAVLAHTEPGTHHGRQFRDGDVDVTLVACHRQLLYVPISPAFPHRLDQLIRRFDPELLHLHLPNTSAFSALLLRAARRLPWIVHWHADVAADAQHRALRIAYRAYRPWEQRVLAKASAIIATSTPYLDASVALAAWRDKVRVIPLGIAVDDDKADDDKHLSAIAAWSDGLRILAVGRLSYYKGFDVLFDALAQVPHASLVLVGSGEGEAHLRARARECGIEARVRFAGNVDDAALRALYANAEVLCLPSIDRSEAFGLVLLEAMRAGIAIVASDIRGSGVGYVVRNGETGLLVPPGDAGALAAALLRLANDESLRHDLGAAGVRRWREEFTLQRAADRTLTLYRDVLAAARKSAMRTA